MSVTIQYPTTSPTHTAVIDSPVVGNAIVDVPRVSAHLAMDASLITTKDTPVRQKVLMGFVNIPTSCADQLTDLNDLLAAAKDNDVRLTDHDGTVWDGKIVNDLNIVFTSEDRCQFNIELVGAEVSDETWYLEFEDSSGFLLLEDGTGYLLLEEAP